MSDLVVKRWTRYGKDRVYVNTADAQRLACLDLVTGTLDIAAADREQEVRTALVAAGYGDTAVVPSAQPTAEPVAPATVPEPPSAPEVAAEADVPLLSEPPVDLAGNRPGEAVRLMAEQELAAMKDRSRIGTVVARVFDMKTDERAWRRGAEGEETVGSRLAKLEAKGWRFLHSVPVGAGDSDIDHVAIGPGGVYTLNTKNHRGKKIWVGGKTVMVDGTRVPYVRNAEFEADRATRMLTDVCGFPVFVSGVLVFLADDLTIKAAPDRIAVVGSRSIARWLSKRPVILEADEVDAIFEAARRPATWRT